MTRERAREPSGALGILGGMGPLASAAFVQTIYDQARGRSEQDLPAVLLLSDPGAPDRTTALLNGDTGVLRQFLVRGLVTLREMGARDLVICCVTLHALLPEVSQELRTRVISLVEVALRAVARGRRRHLLLCTNATRQLRLFERHPLWPRVRSQVVLPGPADQEGVHEIIYRLKQKAAPEWALGHVGALLRKHGLRSAIAGCTEFHLLSRALRSREARLPFACIDPLSLIACSITAGRHRPQGRRAAA
jgi:aspartate racemase